MSLESTVADHCRKFALSDATDKDFQSKCDHDHDEVCDRCEDLTMVLNEIEIALKEMPSDISSDLKEEVTFTASNARKNILAWKSHLLRCINQDDARIAVLEKLDETSVYLVQDWAMKFLPRKFRESQRDWFAKRGIPWHLTVAVRKINDGEFQTMTFVHVFPTCNQDSTVVLAIMDNVIKQLKQAIPGLQSVYYRQDNGGCYHSGPTIIGASVIECSGVSVKRMDFTDPQGGKGACDRKAASIKSHMRVHLNEGNNIETATDMVKAIESSGGIPGISTTLCECLSAKDSILSSAKLDGVSTFSNVEYSKDSLRVWKAYGIGPGKNIALSSLVPMKNAKVPEIVTQTVCTGANVPSFIAPKGRKVKAKEVPNNIPDEQACSNTTDTRSPELFACPEEGCVKTYQRHASLQHHIDTGKHQRALEVETLYDKAACGYSQRLEEQFHSGAPQLQHYSKSTTQSPLPMGWALKSTQTKRFSQKQKDFLNGQFMIGETTGEKVNPALVSRLMMSARDPSGVRLFTSDEFLTTKQITGYFSRMASKRTLPSQSQEPLNTDAINASKEQAFDVIEGQIINDVALRHPILYETYNICELVASSSLNKFSITMLKDICTYLEIPTGYITGRRKAPYTEKIAAFLANNCTCRDEIVK